MSQGIPLTLYPLPVTYLGTYCVVVGAYHYVVWEYWLVVQVGSDVRVMV